MPKITLKLLMALLYVGGLLLVGGLLTRRLQSFDGVIVIEEGRAERWAVRPAEKGRLFASTHRNLPAEVIGFDNPNAARRVLNPDALYDALPLSFPLQVVDAEVVAQYPDDNSLEAAFGGKTVQIAAMPGTTLDVPEGRIVLGETSPWIGLVRDGRGAPGAVVSLQRGEAPWATGIYPNATAPVRSLPGAAVLFRWFSSESAAREALLAAVPAWKSGRWAVRDQGRMHWFDSVVPGSGVVTQAGVEYTLLEAVVTGETPHIRVGRKEGHKTQVLRIAANAAASEDEALFEWYGGDVVAALHAWRDGAAAARVWRRDKADDVVLLEEGGGLETTLPDGAALRLRLDQVMGAGLPATGPDASIMALHLDTPLGEMRLRQGQSLQLKETRLRVRLRCDTRCERPWTRRRSRSNLHCCPAAVGVWAAGAFITIKNSRMRERSPCCEWSALPERMPNILARCCSPWAPWVSARRALPIGAVRRQMPIWSRMSAIGLR